MVDGDDDDDDIFVICYRLPIVLPWTRTWTWLGIMHDRIAMAEQHHECGIFRTAVP
jgi:hypothetical protein